MKLGFLYAGQGSQRPGMGAEFYRDFPEFRAVFDGADLEFDLREVCFSDSDGRIHQTEFTQPCMVAFAVGVTAVLRREGIEPSCAAGLSLGEYSALHCAGVWDGKTAISLAAFRGRAMAEAAKGVESAMIAVLGLPVEDVRSCCEEASDLGVAEVCNLNCPGQVVLGGQRIAVERAGALALERGAKRCMPLKVSGPFHTSLLRPAGAALREKFREIPFGALRIPVFFNCLGGEMGAEDSIPALLVRQVSETVRMEDCIRSMVESGVEAVVEIGPGRVLSGFLRKICPGLPVYSLEAPEDLNRLKGAVL